jgi:hypothetical protein
MAPRILTILTGKTCPKDLTVRRANFHWEAEAGAAAETQS